VPFMKEENGEWVMSRGKHSGETLRHVADTDKKYLQWMFENVTETMKDDEFHALEDMMNEFDIEFP